MLNEVLSWWLAQLRALLPPALGAGRDRRDMLRLRLEPGLAAVRAPGRDAVTQAVALEPAPLAALRAAVGARTTAATLELPAGRMLSHTVSLPLAAERDPGQVLRYEMDRLTPFKAEDLHWSWQVLRRDRAAGLITLRLLLTPRAPLRPALDALSRAGLHLSALTAGPDAIGLHAPPGQRRDQLAQRTLLAACAALALVAAALPFVRQSVLAARTEARIVAARPAVAEAEALRRRAQAETAGTDVLAAQRTGSGSVILMLAALTDALDDDTVLTDLAFRARVATVSGTSGAAVRLIPALSAQPVLANPSFTAPVTRIGSTRREGFTLRTELAP